MDSSLPTGEDGLINSTILQKTTKTVKPKLFDHNRNSHKRPQSKMHDAAQKKHPTRTHQSTISTYISDTLYAGEHTQCPKACQNTIVLKLNVLYIEPLL